MRALFRWRTAVVLVALTAFQTSISESTAVAQFRLAHGPQRMHTAQAVNLFLDVDGPGQYDGAYLAIPSDWDLERVTLLDDAGAGANVAFRLLDQAINRYVLLPERRISSQDRLILGVRTGDLAGAYRVRVTPFRANTNSIETRAELLEGESLRSEFRIERARQAAGNVVLNVTSSMEEPLSAFEPGLAGDAAFTAELWVKTAAGGAVLLSTWDGRERSSYPMELLIDEAGRAVFFRGMSGEHRSMRSEKPVADGSWHHVAVSHDEDAHWSRLFVDGVAADSIFHMSSLLISDASRITLAGRRSAPDAEMSSEGLFSGLLDEVRLWDTSRGGAAIRLDMRRTLPSREGLRVASFDDLQSFGDAPSAVETTASDLSFYEPIRDFSVRLDAASVLLEWRASDPNTEGFVIEKSRDGSAFDEVVRIGREEESSTETGPQGYRYSDGSVASGVTFYRIRQVFTDGVESVSRALKVGMGPAGDVSPSVALGNYPNPFNPSTTITYELTEPQQVQVSVWDLAGQMVGLLVDDYRESGRHQVSFDAKDLPSGTYFVRMRTAEGIRSHQIILTR